ncbi:hypothetical protein BU23DRAFT_550125 [Bimuria novae-zelandiae CBS 107.79]|uniref:Uncharacterized protein n=1 Tax=Bimuria novae-zelandiae CBS 107.79 TaxID=1447943 RepID=A0A6A5VMT3_9PLEO|nr:hypothetical protein BU23DRAFT_550125 [Bimuria novae-zelandiae CBS 107.79]
MIMVVFYAGVNPFSTFTNNVVRLNTYGYMGSISRGIFLAILGALSTIGTIAVRV